LKKTVFLIPVSSRIHTTRVQSRIAKARSLLKKKGFEVYGPVKPVCSPSEAPSFNQEEYDAVVVFVASGGTSRTIAEIAFKKGWTLWAYHENNSLPSALSAREKLEALGGWKGEIVYSQLREAPKEVQAEAEASHAFKALKGSTFLLLAGEDKLRELKPRLERLSEVFSLKALPASFTALMEAYGEVEDREVKRALKERLGKARLIGVSAESLRKPLKLYFAVKSLLGKFKASALTIDCFPFTVKEGFTPCLMLSLLNGEGIPAVCEADLDTLPVFLALSKALKKPTWMANLSGFNPTGKTVTLAHCTAPFSLGGKRRLPVKLRSHFETGREVSLDVLLPRGPVTLSHFSLENFRLTVACGVLVKSQLSLPGMCRSQAEVKVEGSLERLLASTGNHQVLCYGNHVEMLTRFGRKIGAKTVVA